jgi:hypothetical protein
MVLQDNSRETSHLRDISAFHGNVASLDFVRSK